MTHPQPGTEQPANQPPPVPQHPHPQAAYAQPGAAPAPGWQPPPGQPAVPAPDTAGDAATAVPMTPATWCRLAALLATPLGLSIPFDSTSLWVTTTAWAVFAMLAAIVQAVPMFKPNAGASTERNWTIGAVGAGCLLLFWVLVGLPAVASNSGFVLTVAAVAAAMGAATAPGRRW